MFPLRNIRFGEYQLHFQHLAQQTQYHIHRLNIKLADKFSFTGFPIQTFYLIDQNNALNWEIYRKGDFKGIFFLSIFISIEEPSVIPACIEKDLGMRTPKLLPHFFTFVSIVV